MSGVLHPVGPEPSGTYWARRFLVVAMAVLAVLGIVMATTAGRGRATVTANPSPAAPTTATPTPKAKAAVTATAKAAASRTARPTPKATPTPSAAPKKSASAAPKVAPTSSPPRPAKPAAPKPPAPKPPAPKPPECEPAELRATLTGRRTLAPKQATRFNLSLINGSGATCRVRVTRGNFELKIYSGTDRIWSTKDCTRAIPTLDRALRSEEAVEWRLRWDGLRSRKNCKDRPEAPQPGTYFATAQLKGAEPVQLRMILT